MNLSHRHHYLPQFYLKGFVGEDSKMAVYDIQGKRLKKKRFTPKEIFFEYDRNTFDVAGESSDFVEKMYEHMETQIAPLFEKIRKQRGTSILSLSETADIVMFVGFTYWRIPFTDKRIKDVIRDASLEELMLNVNDEINNKELSDLVYTILKWRPAFIGSYRLIKPILDYRKSFGTKQLNEWIVYYSEFNTNGELKELHLIGDNPVILKNDAPSNIYDHELIMPITSGKTLFHAKGNNVEFIPTGSRVDMDTLLFLQSERYICGPNAEYLEKIANLGNIYNQIPGSIALLKNKLFGIFN